MRKTMTITAACLALAALALTPGCKTASSAANSVEELGKAYYNQTNHAPILEVQGTNLLFSVSGATRFALYTPVPAKQIIPRETTWYDSTADVLKTIAPWVFMGYMFHEADIGRGSSTVNNNYASP